MNIENRWTWGNVSQLVALVITIIGLGMAIGTFNEKLVALEKTADQSVRDSRTLIEVQRDVAYIKDAVEDFKTIAQATMPLYSCPDEQPILVASYCRGRPMTAVGE